MTREWKVGDRALLPVVVTCARGGRVDVVWQSTAGDGGTARVCDYDLIPDDRRPDWLPGQPGDVAEWGGRRWFCEEYVPGGPEWFNEMGEDLPAGYDVPADAVLVLPAKTREA